MGIEKGSRLGQYEIIAPLGAGGMGEVYRAKDTRLGRDVAIKALPDAFSRDPERLARFEREARLLASLQHANIAGIHGLEVVDGRRYLVLEYIEGETLAARVRRGAIPVDETIDIARAVAAALEVAHEAGIVHRDLKPGNVMLTSAGDVKVLDFGLAKGGDGTGSASDPDLSRSPTLTHHAGTQGGVILGTAAYMSPEQARGKAVDRRTDIWSFGCLVFECLTARQAFAGETVSDIVAHILQSEPAWSALPESAPERLRGLLRRCLEKDLKRRQRDIGDARLELEDLQALREWQDLGRGRRRRPCRRRNHLVRGARLEPRAPGAPGAVRGLRTEASPTRARCGGGIALARRADAGHARGRLRFHDKHLDPATGFTDPSGAARNRERDNHVLVARQSPPRILRRRSRAVEDRDCGRGARAHLRGQGGARRHLESRRRHPARALFERRHLPGVREWRRTGGDHAP